MKPRLLAVGEGVEGMRDVEKTAQGSEMALVWTLLVAASALAWLLPVVLRHQ
jgi:hypothetical protein